MTTYHLEAIIKFLLKITIPLLVIIQIPYFYETFKRFYEGKVPDGHYLFEIGFAGFAGIGTLIILYFSINYLKNDK